MAEHTINGARVKRRRLGGSAYLVLVAPDDGGFWQAGRIDFTSGQGWRWTCPQQPGGPTGEIKGLCSTLGEAIDACAHRWLQERRA